MLTLNLNILWTVVNILFCLFCCASFCIVPL